MKHMTLAALAVMLAPLAAPAQSLDTLTVAGGCFWCVEADFESVSGVAEAVSGFTGGTVADPTYKEVTRGGTGHYEAVQIRFDPAVVSRAQLLALFVRSIDPTDAGGQFCDRGKSYRTAIFVGSPTERAQAEKVLNSAEATLGTEVVTPVLPLGEFYPAEAYHQDFYKSSDRIFTRFGVQTKARAYKKYRDACNRDTRVRALWGTNAPFAKPSG